MAAISVQTGVGHDEAGLNTTINTTPLIDVMLVLLIIFMITIPVIVKSVPMTLPNARNIATITKPGYKPGGFRPQGGAGGPRKRPETSNPNLIRDFQCVQEKGKPVETVSIRQDSVGWLKQKFIDGREITILGLRNAGAAPIPIDAPYNFVNNWWREAYPLTVKKV